MTSDVESNINMEAPKCKDKKVQISHRFTTIKWMKNAFYTKDEEHLSKFYFEQ